MTGFEEALAKKAIENEVLEDLNSSKFGEVKTKAVPVPSFKEPKPNTSVDDVMMTSLELSMSDKKLFGDSDTKEN
jgi:hypothetical protein